MSKQIWLVVVLILVVGVNLLGHFSPSEAELADQPFSGSGWQMKRYLGLGMGIVSLVVFYAYAGLWPTVIWGTSLGFMQTITFDLPHAAVMLAVVGVLGMGWLRWSVKVVGVMVLVGVVAWTAHGIKWDANQLQVAAGKRLTDEFTTNGYQTGWPSRIKAISYNKYYFGARQVMAPLVGYLDIEQLTSPGQQGATVTRSLWGGKDLPRVYFWAMVLGLAGLWYWKQFSQAVRLGIIVLVGLGMWEAAVALLAGMTMANLPKMAKMGVGVVMVVGIMAGYWHYVRDELVWRDNRPWVMEQMARLALATGGPKKITTLLGRSDLYYEWLAPTPDSLVTFDHFDMTTQAPKPGTVYIGLPGEFVGRNDHNSFNTGQLPPTLTLLKQTLIRDSVSFGNGDAIWVVEAH